MKAFSDGRIKIVTGEYEHGLAEIERLRPITYRFSGNDTPAKPGPGESVPYLSSPHYTAALRRQEYIGLIAQDCRDVLPELIAAESGFIGGQPADILSIDPGPLIYALLNSVKELTARIKVLESHLGLRTF